MAINDGIFASHIRATHSTNPFVLPSQHTICIKASNLQWWKSISPRKKEYKEFNELSKDILHACVGEAHVKSSGNSKTYDPRFWRGIRMEQFPVNTANARTIHKLQGRSLDNVLIHSWDYTGNWIYVALSRVRVMSGLFLCEALLHAKCRGMSQEVRQFIEKLERKRPVERQITLK